MMEKYEEAEKEITRAESLEPDNPEVPYARAMIYAIRGEKDKALGVIKGIDPFYYTILLSNVFSILGMKDEAINNIKEAIERGFSESKTYPYSYLVLVNNHFYNRLSGDSRFKEIVKEEKKKYDERMKKYGKF
jgi:tetratricopeptide (TPR) repeat protein